MKVIIIEDEKPAFEKLVHFLKRYDENTEILASAESVSGAVDILKDFGNEADLLLVDIHLSDGLSFQALDQVPVRKPVIFITAYNQYALEAFKANGIDYLLKPLSFEAFTASIDKLKLFSQNFSAQPERLKKVHEMIRKPSYKERFLIKIGEHIHSIPTLQINLFYAEGRNTYLVNEAGRRFITDYKLESLEELLQPQQFFRVNRSYIINLSAIKDVLVYSNSRLKINPNFDYNNEIIVSREKVAAFKDWFGGG